MIGTSFNMQGLRPTKIQNLIAPKSFREENEI